MARKGLPKKYAKMGFKKGWAALKKAKRGPTKARPRTKPSKTGRSSMKGQRAKELFFGLKDSELVGSVGYALAEPTIDQFTSQMTPNLPVIGQVGDDVIKLVAGLAGRKYVKNPLLRGLFNSMTAVNLYKVVRTYTPNIMGGGTTRSNDGF